MASANVLRTIFTYAVSGLGPYTIAFDYLARKFVQVTLIGPDRKQLVLNTDYRFTSTKAITLIKAAPAGYTQIEIRRYTDASDRLVDFQDGSILRATDLNVSQVQTMHIAEEGRDVASNTLGVDVDGNLDARGRKLVNLVDGVLDGDAVTIRQMKSFNDSALNSKNAAAASAAAALLSEQHSKTSETNSKTSETNSGNSASLSQKWAANPAGSLVDATRYSSLHYSVQAEQSSQASQTAASTATQQAQAASGYASAASVSASAAAQSALTANQQADRAKTEADKLGNMNDFATTIDSVDVPTSKVTFKGGLVAASLALSGNLTVSGVTNLKSLVATGLNLGTGGIVAGGVSLSGDLSTTNNITVGSGTASSSVVNARSTSSSELNRAGGLFTSAIFTGASNRGNMNIYMATTGAVRVAKLDVYSDGSGGKSFQFYQDSGNGTCSGSWNGGSDERHKTDITLVPNALEATLSFRGCTYLKKDGGYEVGMIAQDVEKFCPVAISSTGDREFEDGTIIKNFKYLNIAGASAAYHTEAIKELFGLIDLALSNPDEARSKIDDLKAKLNK